MFSEEQKDQLTSVIAGTMKGLPEATIRPNIESFMKCDVDYGQRIARKVGIKV